MQDPNRAPIWFLVRSISPILRSYPWPRWHKGIPCLCETASSNRVHFWHQWPKRTSRKVFVYFLPLDSRELVSNCQNASLGNVLQTQAAKTPATRFRTRATTTHEADHIHNRRSMSHIKRNYFLCNTKCLILISLPLFFYVLHSSSVPHLASARRWAAP